MKGLKSILISWLIFSLSSCFQGVIAQTWEEFFKQKETQREYLIIQIGALEVQSKLLSESASIFRLGLGAIGDWKELEKDIHATFFDSHKSLGPLSVAQIDRLMDSGLTPDHLLRKIESSRLTWLGVSVDEGFEDWIGRIHQTMKSRCLWLSDEFGLVLGNQLEMEDSNRAKLIAGLGYELTLIQKDLMRFQVLATHRVRMNQQRAKWEKDLSIY
jgi:hypothetical protein